MDKEIKDEYFAAFEKDYEKTLGNTISSNAAIIMGPKASSKNQKREGELTPNFSIEVDGGEVTNQKQSGRCWMFSGLNVVRLAIMKKAGIKNLELSQSYLMFFDKLEKANSFLEYILDTRELDTKSREVSGLLAKGIEDGGYWSYFVALVNKYGVLPKENMPETYSSSLSAEMNAALNRKAREFAMVLRNESKKGASLDSLRKEKEDMMKTFFRILVVTLGLPPKAFDFECRDKDNKFLKDSDITPLAFFKKYAPEGVDSVVSVVNDPEEGREFGKTYSLQFARNVVGTRECTFLNAPIERLKELAILSLKDGKALWFACDVLAESDRKDGVLSTKLFEEDKLFGTTFIQTKGERLSYRQSVSNHAMTLVGVDLDKDGNPLKWKIENSWGDEVGKKGFFLMDDDWFSEYVYEVDVDKKYLTEEEKENYGKKPAMLPFYDPMCCTLD